MQASPEDPAGTAVVVAIMLRGRVTGAIKLGRAHVPYTEGELHLADELARLAGPALENARLYSELCDAVELRDAVISIAPHELRTPMTVMQLQLERLERTLGSMDGATASMTTQLHAVMQQMQRLSRLVGTLFDVSRMTSGSLDIEVEPLDLVALAREAADRYQVESKAGWGALQVTAEGSVGGAWDRLRIEQVITNLLNNAAKYGGGRPIEMSVAAQEGWAVLRVKDGGIGIREDHLDRIFQRFERAVPGKTYGGLGVGLYVARQICAAHGGTIDVESVLGQGSTFTVRLPATALALHIA